MAACREAARQVDEAVQKKTSAMLGGMMPRNAMTLARVFP